MTEQPSRPVPSARRRLPLPVLLLLVMGADFLLVEPLAAEEARPTTPLRIADCGLRMGARTGVRNAFWSHHSPLTTHHSPNFAMARAALPLGSWSFGKLFAPLGKILGDKRRMIQFATIGMCIGLYIMLRK